MAMKEIKRGQIWWGNLGEGIGSEQKGYRPLIVVSNNLGCASSTCVSVVPLTTKIKKGIATHCYINGVVKGTALCEQIRCISKDRLEKYAMEITKAEQEAVDKALKFGLGV